MTNIRKINSCLRWLANELQPFYDNSDLPVMLSSKIDVFYDSITSIVDWDNLDTDVLLQLGFLNWEEDDCGVWFIPKWLYYAIPEGQIVYDKNNKPFEFHKNTSSKETMFGCLEYGVHAVRRIH